MENETLTTLRIFFLIVFILFSSGLSPTQGQQDTEAKKSLKQLDKMLAEFTYKSAKEKPCADIVNAGKNLLTDISRDVVSE